MKTISDRRSRERRRRFGSSQLAWLLAGVLLAPGARAPGAAAGSGALRDPGFEGETVLEDWKTVVYGARPEMGRDGEVRHEGKYSLRVRASELSDTALFQEIALKPGGWYRLNYWVKTSDLRPETASVCGMVQVQQPEGRGRIASGANHQGNTEWTEEKVWFAAPPPGRVRVSLFFAGFGKATGTAWFDDLRLAEIAPADAPVRVTREGAGAGEIQPGQYGQFIEYLCTLVPGMWAEKLYDGSFEGLSPYKFQFIKETDFKEKPWYPSGEVNRAAYTLDKSTKVSGEVSKRITAEEGAPCTVGLSQDGIAVEQGRACDFKCWFRAAGVLGPVRVRLHHGLEVYAEGHVQPGAEWQKQALRLTPKGSDAAATLTIDFRGPGTLWLDNASLMPIDNAGGWRPDVLEAVRALKPGVIRFGGSTVDDPNMADFDWKDTIGDPDRRHPFTAWGGLQPTGPGLEEIVKFCRAAGAEPLICVRVTGRAPKDAAEEVQYFNGAPDTPIGLWRARNGHAEPYRIKYWQVGNELGGAGYEQRLPAFCQAMKAVDPGIKLLSSFPTPGVLKGAGEWLDYVCPHHYSHDLEWMEADLEAVGQMIGLNAPGRPIRVAVTEWNTTAGDAGPKRAMLWTLANALACSRYHNLLHRHCGLVEIANRSNLINSFCSGILQTDNRRLYKTPTYYAQLLYATLAGNRPLKIVSELPANLGPDLSATLSADGKEVTVFAVNYTLEDLTRPLDFSPLDVAAQTISVWTLTDSRRAGEPDVTNSFDEPERVAPAQSDLGVSSGRFSYRFPRLSLTVLRMKAGQ